MVKHAQTIRRLLAVVNSFISDMGEIWLCLIRCVLIKNLLLSITSFIISNSLVFGQKPNFISFSPASLLKKKNMESLISVLSFKRFRVATLT